MKRRREQGDFDVFLNHHGPDVKATFVAHLEDALTCAGFRPFLDARSLMKGDPALESVDQALDRAKVHVAVVSRRYAESKYCLNELVAMVRSGKPVVPVFYGVEPGELRWVESGPFAEAFERHKMRGRTEKKLEEWRDALAALAGITGFRLADYSNEALLKREVVDAVARLTPSNDFVEVEQHIVGLGGSKNKCIEALDNMGDQIGVLGLLGMGGVGKTTLAKVIYNHFVDRREFMHMTFLEIPCNASSSSVNNNSMWFWNLQEQLLWGLFRVEANTSNYRSRFQKVSNLGPVLVVIDNIFKQDQCEALTSFMVDFHPGSRIIITSRDRSLLKGFVGRTKLDHYLFDVSTLDALESNMLFNWHAFQANEAPMEYKHIAEDVVRVCGGLPLALKVIGSCLFDKRSNDEGITIWQEAVDALRQSRDVMDVLRWSYNNLSNLEKRMFVDITCLFYSKTTKEMALTYWTSCKNCVSCGGVKMPQLSLRNLIDKSIIYEGLDGKLAVHDLLRDLGQEIGRDTKSHITCYSLEDEVALANQGSMKTIALNLARSQNQYFEARTFANMSNLHSLILPNGCVINGGLEFMSKELRLLQWRQMPYASMPTRLNLVHMVSLDFSESTNLAFLWTELSIDFEGCPNLHHLNLRDCTSIVKLPESIGQSSQLQDINLQFCKSLEKLPKSIGQLRALEMLNISFCTSLKSLPNTIGTLLNLKFLYASGCSSLINVPNSIEMLSSLEKLDMPFISPQYKASSNDGIGKSWTRLTSLSWGISGGYLLNYGAFASLEILELCDITLTKLPKSFRLLARLKELNLFSYGKRSMQIECLPRAIVEFKMLKELTLGNCTKLKRLPKNLGALISLEYLYIWNCSITKLPKSIGLLSKLYSLSIRECKNLQMLPSSIQQLKSLQHFTFKENGKTKAMATSLHELLKCGSLNSLTDLNLQHNTLIEYPKSLGLHKQLMYLTISCPKLQCLPNSIGDLKMLISLRVSQCHNLKRLPKTLGALISLMRLCIKNCPIEKLPKSMGLLSQLQSLEVTRCKNLKKLPTSIRQLHSLKTFKLEDCGDIEAMGALTTLQGLSIWGSTSITKLPPSLGIVSTLLILSYSDIKLMLRLLLNVELYNAIQNLTSQVLEEDEIGHLEAYYNASSGMTCLLLKEHSLGFTRY